MAEKSVKVMISLPAALLASVDREAEAAEMSRSAYIRDALRLRLARRPDLDRRRRAIDELRRRLGEADWPNAEELVRAERDRHHR